MFTFFQQNGSVNTHQVIQLPKNISPEIAEKINKEYTWYSGGEKPTSKTDIKQTHYLVEAIIIRDNAAINQLLDYDAESDVFYIATHDAIITENSDNISKWRFCFLTFENQNSKSSSQIMEVEKMDDNSHDTSGHQ